MSDTDFKYQRAACLSNGIRNIPNLERLTYSKSHYSTLGLNAEWQLKSADLIVDWGNKRFEITSKLKAKDNKPILSLEDGFIRSIGLGVEGSHPFSIVSDWTGIYYDARRPSDLENILEGADPRSNQIHALAERAKKCIKRITEHNISKYNHAPDFFLPKSDKHRILLVDQTFGDLSIISGQASEQNFETLLSDALSDALEKPNIEILIKTHPDVIAGKKQGYLVSDKNKRKLPPNVHLIVESSNPISLLKQVDEVRVVTSQMGFEACMLGKPVRCYGLPFYAGWGITEDQIKCPRRTTTRSIEEVFSAAYLLYTHYFHPETNEPAELENILSHIERQKHYWKKNEGHFICIGFDRWKHSYVRNYLRSNNNRIEFARELTDVQIQPDTKIVVWGNNISGPSRTMAQSYSLPLLTMEDGFLRSINLGKYGTEPRSLVLDSSGIYFDPNQPSDLENILANNEFTAEELQTANAIRQTITESKVSKYNVGDQSLLHSSANPAQKIILVPGQVGIDASITRGCDLVSTNIGLLENVRNNCPDAYILFKPHPDVVSGNIQEASEDYTVFADQIETTANIHSCLAIADEIHTMTSLVGFEALMLKKPVHTYGRPFYAGWGLTIDHSKKPMPGRSKRLTLEELIVGTLMVYPRYINTETGEFTTAESTLNSIRTELRTKGTATLGNNFINRWWLKVRYGGLGILRSWLT